MLRVSQLFIYPIKSLSGISVSSAKITDRGFEHDRRWMLVDSDNRFLSQREFAKMALLKVSLTDGGMMVSHAADPGNLIRIPLIPQTVETGYFTIWDDTCLGQYVSAEADRWFSDALQFDCRLVYMPDESLREVDERYASNKINSFSDAYPFLMIGRASVDDLNVRAGGQFSIDRFRPNIVFTGGEPYQEDLFSRFTIGGVHFNGVKLCARCPVPNIDQQTAVMGKEPIRTLASYRKNNHKVYLGQNLVSYGEGILQIGDEISILEAKPMPNALQPVHEKTDGKSFFA